MIIYGKNLIYDAIKSKRGPVVNVCVSESFTDEKYLNLLKDNFIKYKVVNNQDFNNLLKKNKIELQNHQSITAFVDDYKYYDISEIINNDHKNLRILILDQINDPHNLGAILRTLVGASYDYLIISKDNQVQLNNTVAKVSSGAIEYAKVVLVNNLNKAIKDLKNENILVVGADISGSVNYKDLARNNTNNSLALILGSEGSGMRALVRKNCDFLVKIPISLSINSLNVSVACGILLFNNLK